jgi:Prolyl oligopeptidase family
MNTTTQTITTATTGNTRFFSDSDFEAAALSAIGKAAQGTSDIGVVFRALSQIIDGDPASWLSVWSATGDDLASEADENKAAGKLRTAASLYLAAADAYARAIFFIDGLPNDDQLLPTFLRHRACWEAFVSASSGRHLPIAIPYEGDTMPGYLFRPDASGAKRPTLVITNGSDGSLSGLWAEGIKAALDRGWNAFVFDGPGQQSMLFERNVPFRHDWEAALTPVVDTLVARDDVDEAALLAFGVSQGGYWLPRALAFEHRFVAAVADGGVMDVATSWYSNLPPQLLDILKSGNAELFNTYMNSAPDDPAVARRYAFRSRPYGPQASAFDLFTEVGKYTLYGVADKITTPLLITDPDDEEFFPGQPKQLFDAVTGPKSLVRFTAAQGANHHCEPLARTRVELVMNDFFDEYLNLGSSAPTDAERG